MAGRAWKSRRPAVRHVLPEDGGGLVAADILGHVNSAPFQQPQPVGGLVPFIHPHGARRRPAPRMPARARAPRHIAHGSVLVTSSKGRRPDPSRPHFRHPPCGFACTAHAPCGHAQSQPAMETINSVFILLSNSATPSFPPPKAPRMRGRPSTRHGDSMAEGIHGLESCNGCAGPSRSVIPSQGPTAVSRTPGGTSRGEGRGGGCRAGFLTARVAASIRGPKTPEGCRREAWGGSGNEAGWRFGRWP